MTKQSINVVMAGDRNVLWGMAVTGRTALEHSSAPLGINILGTGLTRGDERALTASWQHPMLAYVKFHTVQPAWLKRFRSTAYLKSKAAYARYFLGRIAEAGKLVYLDTDLLVLRDLHAAVTCDLGGTTAGVVLDISTRLQGPNPDLTKRLGLRQPGRYFNSGFMVIDLDRWKLIDAENTLIQISIDKFDVLDSQDQDALNILLHDDATIMDVAWNASQYETEVGAADRIIHLIGTIKPWHVDYDYKFKSVFFEWLDKTAYSGRRPRTIGGLGQLATRMGRKVPTMDMIGGKIRRLMSQKH